MRERNKNVSALTLTLIANLTGMPHFTNNTRISLLGHGWYVPELTADDSPHSTDLLSYEAVAR